MSDQLEQDLEALLAKRAAATDAELAAQRATVARLPDRGRRAPGLAWAAVILVAVGFAAAAIWRFEGTVATPPVQPPPVVVVSAPPATPAPSPTAVGTPPAWIGTMVGMLQCKWPIAPIGEAVGDAPIGGEVMDTPDERACRVPRRRRPRLRDDPARGLGAARDGSPAVDPLRQPQRGSTGGTHRASSTSRPDGCHTSWRRVTPPTSTDRSD